MLKKLLLPLLIIAGLIQFGCKKNSSGPPTITGIRLIDTTKRDSLFTRAMPGTEIVIQGNNLDGLKAVFFNDTSAYFNPVYATGSNVIVTIPSSAQTMATNPSVPGNIRLVTDHGTATYNFTLYLPPPYITSIALDNSGTIVTINGGNFQGVKKITFPVTGNDTALSYTVNKAFNQIIAAIPPGASFKDSIRVICTFGTGSFSYPPPMVIKSVSNENAMAGAAITINGSNFIGVSQVTFPGGIPGTNLQTVSVTQLTVTVPPGITAPDSLRIEGVLGSVAAPQLFDSYLTHPSPGYLSTFDAQWNSDNQGFVGWTGGYAAAPAAAYPNATGSVAFLAQGSPMPGHTAPPSQGNAGFVQLNEVPWVGNTANPVAGYSLKFEVYTAQPWSAGAIWVMMGGWYNWHNYLARYAPWESVEGGTFQPSGWTTVTIPLTKFVSISGNAWDLSTFPTTGSPASKFSDYSSTALCFTIVNDQASPDIPANTLNIAIDNIRIVKGQ
jgi:hypothetical protein